MLKMHSIFVSYRIGVSDAGFRLCVIFLVTSQSVY